MRTGSAARTGEATDGSTPTGLTARHWRGTGRVTGENESRIPHNPASRRHAHREGRARESAAQGPREDWSESSSRSE